MQEINEIEQVLETWVEENDGWRELPGRHHPKPIEGIEGLVCQIDSFGGEGLGDQAWVVIQITQTDGEYRTYRKDGYYASHDGFYWDGEFTEVRAVEKTVIVWE